MKKDKIIIFGASVHAGHVIELIEEQGLYEIFGIIDKDKSLVKKHGYSILGTDSELAKVCKTEALYKGIVAVGDNWRRFEIMSQILNDVPIFEFVNAIHPSSTISKKAKIGLGTSISPGVVVNNGVFIGTGSLIASGSVIEHDVNIDHYSNILPGVVIGGKSSVGRNSTLGLGVKVIHNVNIGNNVVIGAGSTVLGDFEDNVVAYGSPARMIRGRAKNEKFL